MSTKQISAEDAKQLEFKILEELSRESYVLRTAINDTVQLRELLTSPQFLGTYVTEKDINGIPFGFTILSTTGASTPKALFMSTKGIAALDITLYDASRLKPLPLQIGLKLKYLPGFQLQDAAKNFDLEYSLALNKWAGTDESTGLPIEAGLNPYYQKSYPDSIVERYYDVLSRFDRRKHDMIFTGNKDIHS